MWQMVFHSDGLALSQAVRTFHHNMVVRVTFFVAVPKQLRLSYFLSYQALLY